MKNLLFYSFLIIFTFSCNGDDGLTSSSNQKAISGFIISNIRAEINEDAKTVQLNLSNSVDLTALAPSVFVSVNATVSPASGQVQDFTNPVIYTVTAGDGSTAAYTVSVLDECASVEQIHAFVYDGKNYELIKLNRTWAQAASCAVERGGYLAEINSNAENQALYDEIRGNAEVSISEIIASDGGDASYIWLGGNDVDTERSWYWDGDNDGMGIHFWEGTAAGSAVDNLYNNWGNEPDNFDDQDGLGLALTDWPVGSGSLGSAGQWNDIKIDNRLYYLIEFD